MLAEAVDALRWLVWAKTKDGARGRNQPEPVPRPGDEPRETRMTGTVLPMDEMAAAFGLPDPTAA